MKNANGFSLIELLITMFIKAILIGVSYPSYIKFSTKVNRTEAHRVLLQIAIIQEQYYIDNGRYASSLLDLGYNSLTHKFKSGNYEVNVKRLDETSFTLEASARGRQKTHDAACQSMSVNELGERGATSNFCWN